MPSDEIGYALPSSNERRGVLSGLVRLNRYLLLLLIVPAGIIYFWPPQRALDRELQRLSQLEQQRDALKGKAVGLEKKLDLIKNDPAYLEVVARDRLHLQKDGEKVFRFEE